LPLVDLACSVDQFSHQTVNSNPLPQAAPRSSAPLVTSCSADDLLARAFLLLEFLLPIDALGVLRRSRSVCTRTCCQEVASKAVLWPFRMRRTSMAWQSRRSRTFVRRT